MALKPNVKNTISVLSLAIGLALVLVLFGDIMYKRSYDNFHENGDRLYFVNTHWGEDDEKFSIDNRVPNVVLPTLMAEMPEIEIGTRYYWSESEYKLGDNEFNLTGLIIDTSFFDTFTFEVIKGNPREDFKDIGTIYLSETKSNDLFGGSDPIGKTIMSDSIAYTIKGIYKDIPKNSIVPKAAFLKPITEHQMTGTSWYGGAQNYAVLLLREGVSEKQAEINITKIVDTKYDPVKAAAENRSIKYSISLVSDQHKLDYSVSLMIAMTSFMILLLIIVTALNYSLISVSSLASRLKEFAVHKCNGASGLRVIGMIFIQTAIQTLFALGISIALIIALENQIAQFLTPIDLIFSTENLFSCALIVLFIIVVSAIIPSKIFANISVMSLFRNSRNSHQSWKKVMLFLQLFFSINLIILAIMGYLQYDYMLNKDIGYDYDKLIYTDIKIENRNDIEKYKEELSKLSSVEDITYSDFFLMYGLSGMRVMEDGAKLFSPRYMETDENYFDVHKMDIVDGKAYRDGGSFYDVVVNEKFVESIHWDKDKSAVGKTFRTSNSTYRVIGVVNNFQCAWSDLTVANYFPVVMFPYVTDSKKDYDKTIYLTIKLNEITPQNLDAVRAVLKKLNPATDSSVSTYRAQRLYQFENVKKPMDSIALSGLIIFLISIIGLYGYISNELQYRHREIALRKVYGASVISIIKMIYRPIFIILCIATPLAVVGGYYGGVMMLGSTLPYMISMPWWIFVSVPMFILLFTYGIVAGRTFKVASENPIKAIKL